MRFIQIFENLFTSIDFDEIKIIIIYFIIIITDWAGEIINKQQFIIKL